MVIDHDLKFVAVGWAIKLASGNVMLADNLIEEECRRVREKEEKRERKTSRARSPSRGGLG